MRASAPGRPVRAAVFASGSGSNFQALLDAEAGPSSVPPGPGRDAEAGEGAFGFVARGAPVGRAGRGGVGSREAGAAAPWQTVLLVSDREGTGAADRARRAGVPTRVIAVAGRSPDRVEAEMLAVLEAFDVEVVFLAGYLRLVPAGVVGRYPQRILNVHPALLPSFGGKGMWGHHVHRAVLEAGVRITGATVHFADQVYDRGEILAQWPVPVEAGDSPETLAARVLEVEHRLYPTVAWHVCRALQQDEEPGPLSVPDTARGTAPLPTL